MMLYFRRALICSDICPAYIFPQRFPYPNFLHIQGNDNDAAFNLGPRLIDTPIRFYDYFV